MKMKLNKMLLCCISVFVLMMALPMKDAGAVVDLRENDGMSVITGFETFDVNEEALHLPMESKPTLHEITEMMPETLEVYLGDAKDPRSIDVEWYCVGDDYEESNNFYFQFSPMWDKEKYQLSDEIDLLTEAPYVAVFIEAVSGDASAFAVTNRYYETFIFDYLTDKLGYHTAAACGAMANIYAESSFVPINLQDSFEKSLGFTDASYTMAVDDGSYTNFVRDSAGYGLCQWTFWSRKQALLDFCTKQGTSIGDPGMQLSFLNKELMAGATGKYMKAAPNTEQGCYDVGYYFCQNFERPAQILDEKSIVRGNLARNYYWQEYCETIDYGMSISGHNVPKNMNEGDAFSIKGKISSGARLWNLTAGVFDGNGKMVIGKNLVPNEYTFDLSTLNTAISFKTLKPGVYYYRVSATNAGNTKTFIDQLFVVFAKNKTIEEGAYMLVPMVNRSMTVSVEKHSDALAAKLYQENNTNSEYQYFEVIYDGNGYYKLKNKGSGHFMDIPNGIVTNGGRVQQYSGTGAAAQKWQILPLSDSYCLIPKSDLNYCLSIADGSASSGAKVVTTKIAMNKSQKFKLITGDIEEVFSDVNKGEWYIDYLVYVYENGLMSGNDGKFEPNKAVTKAMVAQVLYNLEGQPKHQENTVFSELKDVYAIEWYADAVAWAYGEGIITGDLNTRKFSPNADVTREQLALMLYRYAAMKSYDRSATSEFENLINADKISNWAEEGMRWAVGSELISGIQSKHPSGSGVVYDLAPQNTATRAQTAAILMRFCTKNLK